MPRRIAALAAALAFIAALPPEAGSAEPSWVGKYVVPKKGGAKLLSPKIGPKGNYPAVATLLDMEYRVEKVFTNRLYLRHRGTLGWVNKKDVIPREDVVRFFTAQIK